jgi:hypothetical protein
MNNTRTRVSFSFDFEEIPKRERVFSYVFVYYSWSWGFSDVNLNLIFHGTGLEMSISYVKKIGISLDIIFFKKKIYTKSNYPNRIMIIQI